MDMPLTYRLCLELIRFGYLAAQLIATPNHSQNRKTIPVESRALFCVLLPNRVIK